MGTRNLSMLIDRTGEVKVAQYGQWDGYPSGQGAIILDFCKDKAKMKKLEETLCDVSFVKGDDVKKYLNNLSMKEEEEFTEEEKYLLDNYYHRDVAGKIFEKIVNLDLTKLPKELKNYLYLTDATEFGKNSLMCEWAYIINLQTNKLQCFAGFNQDKSQEYSMFATIQEEADKRFDYDGADKYYGIKLLKEYDLDNLPTEEEFVKELDPQEE